uniref:Uncharacterized protein n=1 Tax=Oryza punctata TaxID=4537 RepID=A0A0E0KUV3_ORYPU
MPKRPPSKSHHGSSRSSKRTSSASSSHGSSGSVEERPYSSGRHGSSGRMDERTAPSCRHRSRRTDNRPSSTGRHGSGRTANKHERPAPATRRRQRRKKYLYLVMDDWEKGYGIYRVDVDSFDPDAEFDSDSEAECQARPRDDELSPLVRVEAPIKLSRWITAHGSKIFMMLPVRGEAIPGIPVFDTVTRAMMVCPWPENYGEQFQPFCVSVGDRLIRLCNPCFQVLGAQPPPRTDHLNDPWAWEEISDDNALSMPPFSSSRVSAYAVHPDGRTIWVSGDGSYGDRNNTFSFGTEHVEWAHVGEWLMPFEGQAHYVGELDAWVGLSRVHKGYLCCCPNDGYGPWGEGPFTSRIGSEMMFRADKYNCRAVKLLYMGKSKFCMVESKVHNFPANQCKCKVHGDEAEVEAYGRSA